jgi:hypothetical protein
VHGDKKVLSRKEKRISEVRLLKYPPKECVTKMGRANLIEESVLYATFDPITAYREMRPMHGDLITISKWNLKKECNLKYTPIFKITGSDDIHNEMSLGFLNDYKECLQNIDSNIAEMIDLLINFMAECFSKEVDDNNMYDYFLSAYFSNKLLHHFESGSIEAILYPSVRQSLQLSNIAVKADSFDEKFELVEVLEGRVYQQPRGYFLDYTIITKDFNDDEIFWS